MSSAPSQTSRAIAPASLLRVQDLPVCNVMVLHATHLVPRIAPGQVHGHRLFVTFFLLVSLSACWISSSWPSSRWPLPLGCVTTVIVTHRLLRIDGCCHHLCLVAHLCPAVRLCSFRFKGSWVPVPGCFLMGSRVPSPGCFSLCVAEQSRVDL